MSEMFDGTGALKVAPVASLAELATEINREHEAAERAINDSLEHARRCGELLIEAKRQCEHGEWETWVESNFSASYRTAAAYMRIAKRWDDIEPKVQSSALLSIDAALRLLAAPRESQAEPDALPALPPPQWGRTSVRTGVVEETDEGLKRCGDCDREWQADLGYCPYCNLTPEARVEGLRRAEESGARPAVLTLNHRAQGTGENEWYTPAKYVELARAVMGDIDVDPASSTKAQEIVRAGTFYTADDDGLAHEWNGRVWLNPPYSQPAIHQFAEKMVQEVSAGRAVEAIMLTHNYTDTAWFHLAESLAAAICFTRGRIGFVSPTGTTAAPTQGQAFFYYGSNVERFREVFGGVGFVR